MLFVLLVSVIPSTTIEALAPAIFCFEAFVDELSMDAKPEPVGLSVAVTRNAFSAPVSDFKTRLNVPSPVPTMLAVTPQFKSLILSLNEAKVSVEETVISWDETIELETKLPEDQSPLSSVKVPLPTIAVVDEKPLNAKVCPVANELTVMLESKVVAFEGSLISTVIEVSFEEGVKAVEPFKVFMLDDNPDNAFLTSAIAEIEVLFLFILSLINSD